MTDFRALCAELLAAIQLYTKLNPAASEMSAFELTEKLMDTMSATAAAMAEQPVGGTDEELRELRRQHDWPVVDSLLFSIARAVLARWGQTAAAPVPVSERLPGPEDCDAEGRCWWGRFGPNDWCPDWTLTTHEVMLMFCDYSPREVWLPAHALPVPTVEEVM